MLEHDSDYREPDTCPYCGKDYEDFSDLGCEHCDDRYQPDDDREAIQPGDEVPDA